MTMNIKIDVVDLLEKFVFLGTVEIVTSNMIYSSHV
jgi:hypothetical protein